MMETVTIVVLCALAIFCFFKYLSGKSPLKQTKNWKINDVVFLKNDRNPYKLSGWNKEHFFVITGEEVMRVNWDRFQCNKSSIWRQHFDNCVKDMGFKPSFNSGVSYEQELELAGIKNEDAPDIQDTYNGKPIVLLTETECQIFIKECLEKEDYDMAEKIKKQLEKYR